ncbi:hypothetical protein GGF46_001768 [Coemansia sp. RSA 552]|nr:hypothetical protein GGF46_001768 [Coemansia sp. RSA 552]
MTERIASGSGSGVSDKGAVLELVDDPDHSGQLGMRTQEAKASLLQLLDTAQTRIPVPAHLDVHSWLARAIVGTTVVVAAALVANGARLITSDPVQTRGIASVVEAGLLLASVGGAWWVIRRESALEEGELDQRLRAVAAELRAWRVGGYADLRTPQLPTVTTYMALRDGSWRDVPTLLLVAGDIVALAYGEAAPCAVRLRGANQTLERGDRLMPLAMRSQEALSTQALATSWDPQRAGHAAMAGRVLFVVDDTPLRSHLQLIAKHHRRTGRSVLQNQIAVVVRLLVARVLPTLVAVALVANAVIYGLASARGGRAGMGVEAILGKTIYVVFPFACTCLWPVFWIATRIFAGASEVVLFDALQQSKTDYEDMEDIDEFDAEALPPTKDVRVGGEAIWRHVRWAWTNCDHRNLSRSSNLAETLGTVTVICSIDKEGTIAEPFCTPEQIVVPEDDSYAVLDLAEKPAAADFIADEGWQQYLPELLPLGLDCDMNTRAHEPGRSARARADLSTHRRHNSMRGHGKALPAQDTCLCQIGKGLGFAPGDLAKYELTREVDVFAPFHQATETQNGSLGVFGAASFTSAIIATPEGAGNWQMLTDGNVELVLGMCLDYFDGSSVRPLDDRTMAMYYSLYLNALQQDLQCLAFAYRPLAIDGADTWPVWPQPKPDSARSASRGVYVDLWLDLEALPSPLSPESSASSSSANSISSTSSGSTPEPSTMVNLPEHLTEAVRHAQLSAKAKFLQAEPIDSDSYATADYTHGSLAQFTSEEEFLRDAVTEQIFLGLVTFTYEPKTDVCDFIEDLDLAGIRFVHFSRTNGRQSKSFAEQLGLETDWNTCILLSTPGTEGGGGYVEDHDIKARLPRGINNIRTHLREVDDIPLQVSLFAECTAQATREMITIFQDHGDVACCVGSALHDSNTLTFAVADLAIGVEPIPHFNRIGYALHPRAADDVNDGSISTAGALSTQYALGAALTCLPCPLFLQHDTSPYTLMQVFSEARRLLACMQQMTLLLALVCLALCIINLAAAVCLLPPALPGYMLLWVLWIAAPLVAATLLFSPRDDSTMSTMPLKNHSHVSDLPRFAVYAAIRMAPVVAVTMLVYALALTHLLGLQSLGDVSRELGYSDWLHLSPSVQWAVVGAQTYAMVAFVFHLVCVSSTMMHRTRTLIEMVPVRCWAWCAGCAVCLLLTFAFAALLLGLASVPVARIRWYTYVVGLAAPPLLLFIQDLCKLHDKKRWTRLQKLAKLEFKTKLGLHSPL